MYKDKKIAVIIPAFNEERLIAKTIKSIPAFVDHLIVVDDKSTDRTQDVLAGLNESRLTLIKHRNNQGVGGAIVSGYKSALDLDVDVAVVMGADAQMDPQDLPRLLEPVVTGRAGYAKGNRLTNYENIRVIPKVRLAGIIFLTIMTRFCSGYWHVVDSQCGYTAVSREILKNLDLDKLYKRYGFPSDMLAKLNSLDVKVEDISVRAIYNNRDSKLKIFLSAPAILFLLIKLYFQRILNKYIFTT